jgi:hypothetical protein
MVFAGDFQGCLVAHPPEVQPLTLATPFELGALSRFRTQEDGAVDGLVLKAARNQSTNALSQHSPGSAHGRGDVTGGDARQPASAYIGALAVKDGIRVQFALACWPS